MWPPNGVNPPPVAGGVVLVHASGWRPPRVTPSVGLIKALRDMPYALILMVGSVLLGAYYVAIVDASRGSKGMIGAAVAMVLAIWWWRPQWLVVSTLLQLAVSVYVLLYLKAHPRAA